jgi:DnaJ like chaperone protein
VTIWGKIIGGAAGLALGGPLGALIGAAAGHAVDMAVDVFERERAGDDPTRQVAFTIAVIALAAKMARADGEVTADETAMFRRIFTVKPEEERNLQFVFDLARRSPYGFESYARQIAKLLADYPRLLQELLGGLFLIATADGRLRPAEEQYLREVARIFGFEEAQYQRARASYVAIDDMREDDPYRILGLSPKLSDAEIKTEYRRLVRENHPDRLIAEGLPDEFVSIANAKLARINEAYDRLTKSRGIT